MGIPLSPPPPNPQHERCGFDEQAMVPVTEGFVKPVMQNKWSRERLYNSSTFFREIWKCKKKLGQLCEILDMETDQASNFDRFSLNPAKARLFMPRKELYMPSGEKYPQLAYHPPAKHRVKLT